MDCRKKIFFGRRARGVGWRYFLACLVIKSCIFSVPCFASEEDTEAGKAILRQVFADWQKRLEKAPVILYRLKGTRLWTKGSFNPRPSDSEEKKTSKDNPDKDVTGSVSRTILLDFSHSKYRIDS